MSDEGSAGVTERGASMSSTGHPHKRQDTHKNHMGVLSFMWVSCLLLLLWGGAVLAQETPVAGGPFCPIVFQVPERPVVDVETEEGDTYLNADSIDLTEKGISHLTGSVEMSTDTWQARADDAVYNDPGNFVDLSGDVKFWEESLFLAGEGAHIDVEDSTATVSGAEYYLHDSDARGRADELFIDPGTLTSGKGMTFTTCAPENGGGIEQNFWRISARELHLDHDTDRGSGRNIVLKIKDIPVFYAPYFTFPLSRERKSGFLAPGIGKNSHGGFETRLPYYWNISPSMDATITPRVLANSGVMGMLEYRYLRAGGEGRVNLEYLPGDVGFDDRDRSMLNIELTQSFLGRGRLYVDYNQASDPEYLEDFGTDLAISSTRYLPRRADVTYRGRNWNVLGRLHSYQIVDQSIRVTSRPYKNLPRLQFRYRPLSGNKKINLDLRTDFTYFDRTGETGVTVDVTGFRADLYPTISYPIRTQAAFLVPRVGVRFTQYELDKQGPFKKSPNRTLPIVSVDSGVFLERDFRMRDRDFQHTLEPRLFYLYVPHEDQNDLPVFDSSVFNLDYNALFRENRFSGYDRIGDTNQVTLALGSRLINRGTGKQLASLQVAQSFYLEDQDVIRQILGAQGELVDIGIPENDLLSPLIVEAGANLRDDLTLGAEIYWDINDRLTRKMALTAQYNPAGSKVINLAYRVRRAATGQIRRTPTDIEQSDVSFSWPLTDKLNTVGRWNYAVSEGRTLDLFFGVEYEGCCFAIKAVGRRFLSNLEGDFNTGFFLQLELKGLGSIGQRTVDLLNQAIPGYGDSLPLQ
ncbi:MAG: LPS assembly protein LptD [Gammaproteobacteria bacterium]|nr:LPS assembly protein LptD [Gammaproteobacteria bacterium]